MSRNRWITVLLAVALLFICGLSLALVFGTYGMLRSSELRRLWYGPGREEASATLTETHRFEVGPEPLLVVSTAAGDVRVEGRPEARAIEVLQTVEGRGADAATALAAAKGATVRVEADEAVIRLVYEAGEPLGFGDRERAAVSFVVVAPQDTRLDLEAGQGDLSASGTRRGGALSADFGDVRVSDLEGAIEVGSRNGRVEVARVSAPEGDHSLRSDFGDLTVRGLDGRDIVIGSQNGSLSVEGLRADGKARLQSTFGGIGLADFQAADLVVESQNGAVDLRDGQIAGEITIDNAFGDVALAGVRAAGTRVSAGNGAVDLDGTGGHLDLSNRFGAIAVRQAEGARLGLQSSNGGIDFAGSLDAASDHRVESGFGDIRLTLPPDSHFDIQLETALGEIHSELPVTLSGTLDPKSWIGRLGQGGRRLVVVTQNGNIELLAGPADGAGPRGAGPNDPGGGSEPSPEASSDEASPDDDRATPPTGTPAPNATPAPTATPAASASLTPTPDRS